MCVSPDPQIPARLVTPLAIRLGDLALRPTESDPICPAPCWSSRPLLGPPQLIFSASSMMIPSGPRM